MANQRLDQPSEDVRTQTLIDHILVSLTAKNKDDDSHMVLAMAHSPSPTFDEDEPEDTSNENDEGSRAAGAPLEKAKTEDTVEYPPPAQAALAMLALLLALFLSALVSRRPLSRSVEPDGTIDGLTASGPNNHRHSLASPHRRVRFSERHRLVRKRLPPHLMLLHPIPRPHLHLLLAKVRLPVTHSSLRDRVRSMWLCAELDGFHRRESDLRCRCRRTDEWRNGTHDQCDSAGEEARVDGRCWCNYGCRERCWTVAWRSIHDECELEVVLLQ